MQNLSSRLFAFILFVTCMALSTTVIAQSATKGSQAIEDSQSKAVAQAMQKQKQTLSLPERVAPDQAKWYKSYKLEKKQPNLMKPEDQLLNEADEPEIGDDFVDLFNGEDLTGWTPKGGTCTFEVEDGHIVGTCVRKSNSTYLCTDRDDYKDFVFTCEMKWEVDGNTGVMFRSKIKPNKKATEDTDETKIVYGPQVEMEDFAKARFWFGAIYGQSCGGYFYPLWLKEHVKTRTAIKKDGWNRMTLSAKGKEIRTWINGVPMAYWIDEKNEYPQGYFGLQIHKGSQGTILFRNLKIKELESAAMPAAEVVE